MARIIVHVDALDAVDPTPVLRRLADEVADDARRIVPVDTGLLRSSIRVGAVTPRSARIHADAPYAAYVELGTRHMRAQPYLRPALYRVRKP